jgi:polyvinyl alcohol dehydrogenase (cytochrome)
LVLRKSFNRNEILSPKENYEKMQFIFCCQGKERVNFRVYNPLKYPAMNMQIVCALLLCYAMIAAGAVTPASPPQVKSDPHATINKNHGLVGWRYYDDKLDSCNVGSLKLVYNYTITGVAPVSLPAAYYFPISTESPTFYDDVMYWQDFVGGVYATYVGNWTMKWQASLYGLTGWALARTRSTPTLVPERDLLVIGDWTRGSLYAVRMSDGSLVWNTPIDTHPNARVLQSPIIYQDVVYIGMSSGEEGANNCMLYQQCSFRGSMTALDLLTGQIKWKAYNVPAPNGVDDPLKQYAGGAVWVGTPTIDTKRNMVCYGTGNNYRVPDAVYNCTAQGFNCDSAENLANAVICRDLDTGDVVISKRFVETQWKYDAFTSACDVDGVPVFPWKPGCPQFHGNDGDLSVPMLLEITSDKGKKTPVIIAGSKTGNVYCFNRVTGDLVWSKKIGPEGLSAGGIAFGYATDGTTLIFGNVNSGPVTKPSGSDGRGTNWTLINPVGPIKNTNGGFWTAMTVDDGKVLWQRAEPNTARVLGPLTFFKSGLVLSGSMANQDADLFAFDARSGQVAWTTYAKGSRFQTLTPYKGYYCGGTGYLGKTFYGTPNEFYCYQLSRPGDHCSTR